jgi:hypothetical protein
MGDLVGRKGETASLSPIRSVIARRQTPGRSHGVSRSILAPPFIFGPAFCGVHGTVNNRELWRRIDQALDGSVGRFEETACLRQDQEVQAEPLSLKQRVGYKPHLGAKPRIVPLL